MRPCKSRNILSASKESLGSCAITLRIPRMWLKKLDRLIPRLSEQHDNTLNRQDLLREAVRKVYFAKAQPWNLLKRPDGLSYHDQLRVMERIANGEKLASDEIMNDKKLSALAIRQVLYLAQLQFSPESEE